MLDRLEFLRDSFSALDSSWQELLSAKCSHSLIAVDKKLKNISLDQVIYPPQKLIFNALKHTKFAEIKVVILGQDPYHGDGEANGLAFAVNNGIPKPPSLRNIYTELLSEYKGWVEFINANSTDKTLHRNIDLIPKPHDLGNDLLLSWVDQGVLLLNATLTVIKDQANSLSHIGWQFITDKLIALISDRLHNVVFILWGNFAKSKSPLIDAAKHLILTAAHPSPLSAHRGFFGCNHFVLANQYLIKNGRQKIRWLPDTF